MGEGIQGPLAGTIVGTAILLILWILGIPLLLPLAVLGVAIVIALPLLLLGRFITSKQKRSFVYDEARLLAATIGCVLLASIPFIAEVHPAWSVIAVGGATLAALPLFLIVRLISALKDWRKPDKDEQPALRYDAAGFYTRTSLFNPDVVSGTHAGVAFRHWIIPAGKHNIPPARAAVSIATDAPGEFSVSPEDGGTALAKAVGLGDEFQIGDAALDKLYYFTGTNEEYVKAVFDHDNLQRLRVLLGAGYTEVDKEEGQLKASAVGGMNLPVPELKATVERLAAFRLPANVAGQEDHVLTRRQAMYVVRFFAVVLGVAAADGFFGTHLLVDSGSTFVRRQLPLAAGLFIALLAAGYFTVRGRSIAPKQFRELCFYAMMLAPAMFGVLMCVNEKLDTSEASVHETQLIRNYQVPRSKGGANYHLVFASWQKPNTGVEFRVNVNTYLQAVSSKERAWQMRTHEGWLHENWMESMDIRKTP